MSLVSNLARRGTLATAFAAYASAYRVPTVRGPCSRVCGFRATPMMCDAAAEEAPPPPGFPPPAEPTPYDLLDVRVGKIVEAWEHPDSDKLWVEKIDVGEPEPRQIASGLRAYYAAKEDVEGSSVIVVCNLKEAKLGGVASNGMVLCTSNADKSEVAFVAPPAAAKPGERVLIEGVGPTPPASGNQMKKKKWMDKAAEGLKAVDGVATYDGTPLVVAGAQCTSPVPAGTIN